jgi:hypothetical protein
MSDLNIHSASMNSLLKGLLYFVGGLIVLLIIAQILVSLFADDYAADYIKDQVRTSTDSTYSLNFDDFDLNVISGSATIKNLRINADTAAFSTSSSSSGTPSKTLFKGTVGEVDVSGVNVFSTLLGNELHIGSITLTKPDLAALKNPRNIEQGNNGQFASLDSTIYAAVSKKYSALEIGEFTIRDGHGLFTQSGDTLTSIGGLNLKLRNIRVDSASAQSGRTFITDDVSTDVQNLMINLPDSLNKLQLGRLNISSDAKTIALDSLQLIPRYPRFEFGYKNEYEIDRIDLNIPEIRFREVDFNRFIDSARFYARSVDINNARMVDFRNKNLPFPPNNEPPLPHTALQNMSQKIKIDSLQVNNAYIEYNEYWYEAPQAGTLTFEKLNAAIYDVTNYPEDIESGISMIMDAQTKVMGEGLLEAHFEFPMDTKSGFHKVTGTLGSMPLTAFNPMLKYVAFAGIDEGQLNSLEFDMTLNNSRSNGTLIMKYENFKISLLDKETIKQQGIIKNLGSFVANTFIIKKNNTPEDGMRAGPIKFERIQRKSVFNYWWKSLLSGIKPSLGL